MKKGINKSILFYIASVLFFIASAIGFTSGNESSIRNQRTTANIDE